jgi:hypothetical protein
MRFMIFVAVAGLLSTGCAAHAHSPKKPDSGVTVNVTLGWKWVDAHRVCGRYAHGRWIHPVYGTSHRGMTEGPPVMRPHPDSQWIPGHWTHTGHHRTWVRGHWKNHR